MQQPAHHASTDPQRDLRRRFAAKVRLEGDHELWVGGTSKGAGVFKLGGRAEKAHRVAWLLAHGSLPTRALERTCDAPACVAAAHHRQRPAAGPGGPQPRLPHGMGSVRQRGPGAFTVEIVTGRDPLDPRRKVRETFTVRGTVDDVRRAVEAFHARARVGDRINLAAKGTFGEPWDGKRTCVLKETEGAHGRNSQQDQTTETPAGAGTAGRDAGSGSPVREDQR